jgi:hypothetical protein
VDLRRRERRDAQEMCARCHRVRKRRAVKHGAQHGCDQHAAIDGGRRRPAWRHEREPLVGVRIVDAVRAAADGRRLVKDRHARELQDQLGGYLAVCRYRT